MEAAKRKSSSADGAERFREGRVKEIVDPIICRSREKEKAG